MNGAKKTMDLENKGRIEEEGLAKYCEGQGRRMLQIVTD